MGSRPHGSIGGTEWLKALHNDIDWGSLWVNLKMEIIALDSSDCDAIRNIPFLRTLQDGYEECYFFHLIPHQDQNFEKYLKYLGYVGHSSWAVALRGIGDKNKEHSLSFWEHRGLMTGLFLCPDFIQFINHRYPHSEPWNEFSEEQVQVLENYLLDVELIKSWMHSNPNAKIEALRFCQYMFGMNWRDLICLKTEVPSSPISGVDATYLDTKTYLIVNLKSIELWLLLIKQLDD
jgi:hypothetical protein